MADYHLTHFPSWTVIKRKPIDAGMPFDASQGEKSLAKSLLLELKQLSEPFIHRMGSASLRSKLPDIVDTLFYLQPSVIQNKIIKKYEMECIDNNFFR